MSARPGRLGMNSIRAEWTKLRTVPSTPWLLLAMVAATIAVGAMATALADADDCRSSAQCLADTARLSLTGVHLGQLPGIALAVLSMSAEYATGTVRTTLAAVPTRLRVFMAKAIVVTVPILAAAAVGVLGSIGVGRLVLADAGFADLPSLADGPTLRAAVGTTLYCGLIALLSLGAAALVRDAAVAITAIVAVLYAVPILARFITSARAQELIGAYAPLHAGLAVQTTLDLDRAPIGPWAGLGVLAAWTTAAVAAGALRFLRSDP